MASITIDVDDAQFQQLQELAKSQGLSVEELLQARLRSWPSFREEELNNAIDYVLNKNAGFYQRLT